MDDEEDEAPYVRPALPVDGEPDFESVRLCFPEL